jgi:hypothetical protein
MILKSLSIWKGFLVKQVQKEPDNPRSPIILASAGSGCEGIAKALTFTEPSAAGSFFGYFFCGKKSDYH